MLLTKFCRYVLLSCTATNDVGFVYMNHIHTKLEIIHYHLHVLLQVDNVKQILMFNKGIRNLHVYVNFCVECKGNRVFGMIQYQQI